MCIRDSKLVEHGVDDDGKVLYKVRWYGYAPSADTWEPTEALPHNLLSRYHAKRGEDLPTQPMGTYAMEEEQSSEKDWIASSTDIEILQDLMDPTYVPCVSSEYLWNGPC